VKDLEEAENRRGERPAARLIPGPRRTLLRIEEGLEVEAKGRGSRRKPGSILEPNDKGARRFR
jgi:hypothetical protein